MIVIYTSIIDDVFNSLFYGSGSWLGLLLMVALIAGLVVKWKIAGALFVPVSVFMGINYFTRVSENSSLAWHGIIMWLVAVLIFFYMALDSD